jgi:hypothetical protein
MYSIISKLLSQNLSFLSPRVERLRTQRWLGQEKTSKRARIHGQRVNIFFCHKAEPAEIAVGAPAAIHLLHHVQQTGP